VQTLALGFARVPFVEACRRRYGDVLTFRTLFDSGFVMVLDPAAVQQVFRASPDVARAGAANAGVEPLHGNRSLMVLDGDDHLRRRRLSLPAFHGRLMRAHETVMRSATDRAIESWPVGRPFALLPSMYSLTLDVIIGAVFGVEEAGRAERLKRAMRAVLAPIHSGASRWLALASGGRLGSARAARRFEVRHLTLERLIDDEIARRRLVSDLERRTDVLSTLLLARDEASGESMSDEEVRDELVTLLIAGHETTAAALAWSFELLLRDQRVLRRLRAAEDGEYLDAVVKEALRLRPVATGVGRLVCDRPLEVGGYTVQPGVEVSPSIDGIHLRSDLYPEPRAFRPERFLGADPPESAAWIPFGGGTRRCLGASFAQFEMKVVIRRVLERTELRRVGRRRERVVRRTVSPPTPSAIGRSLRRGRRWLPRREVRVLLTTPALPAADAR
jgi:cytochrome P450 family 135